MKFTVQMKDPDTLQDAVKDAVKGIQFPDLSEDEVELVREKREEAINAMCSTWFEWGEYLRVEIDTDAETCTVLPVKQS